MTIFQKVHFQRLSPRPLCLNLGVFLVISFILVFSARGELGSGQTTYSPLGKRDPFRAPDFASKDRRSQLGPLQRFSISQFELKAIIKTSGRPVAMFKDPEGTVHLLGEGAVLGKEKGRISLILNKEVVITETTKNYLGVEKLLERVLSLPGDALEGEDGSSRSRPSSSSSSSSRSTSSSSGRRRSSNIRLPTRRTPSFSNGVTGGGRRNSRTGTSNGLSTVGERAPKVNRSGSRSFSTKGSRGGLKY